MLSCILAHLNLSANKKTPHVYCIFSVWHFRKRNKSKEYLTLNHSFEKQFYTTFYLFKILQKIAQESVKFKDSEE